MSSSIELPLESAKKACANEYLCDEHNVTRDESITRQELGRDAEYNVYALLLANKRSCEMQRHSAPFDLLVDGWAVEVKVAQFQLRKGKPTWQFNIHRHGRVQERCDFYILRLEGVPYSKAAVHLLLRAPLCRPTISVTFRSLISKYSVANVDFRSFLRGDFGVRETENRLPEVRDAR